MFWSGDGHDHWHVRDVEAYELIRLDNGRRVGTGVKHGFCYFDNTPSRLWLPGAPHSSVYGGCGTAADLRVTAGLSVGWGDTYPAGIAFQWIDITGLKAGRYRLRATADPANWFAKTNNANNSTWINIKLTGAGVRVWPTGRSPDIPDADETQDVLGEERPSSAKIAARPMHQSREAHHTARPPHSPEGP